MAIDNLNFYSTWLPAGQQTDRYSSQPWCLRSKNLDIFSSSKSVKATAWSTPTAISSDIIKQDWKLKLKTDWKVYEETANGDVLVVDPSVNFPVKQVSYTWKNGTYADAQWGTVKDMVVKNVWDDRQAFTVYTDRSAYYYNKTAYVLDKEVHDLKSYWSISDTRWTDDYFTFSFSGGNNQQSTNFKLRIAWHDEASTVPMRLKCAWVPVWTINLTITTSAKVKKLYYDAQMDSMVAEDTDTNLATLVTTEWTLADWMIIHFPVSSETVDRSIEIKDTNSSAHQSEFLGIDLNYPDNWSPNDAIKDWDFSEYYAYLPIDDNREFKKIWEYYWLPAQTFQILYNWEWSWIDKNWQKVVRYEFQQYMWWANPSEMTVVWMMAWNENIYMIGNMDWNWYIFPCDLSWGRWTPYIAYWCEFTGVTNIDYLMYLVWTDRGISQLWAFNQQELVAVIWWNKTDYNDIIDNSEQYRFDWRIVEYRWDLVLTTADNRVFQYWQTFWGKGWTFINDIPWTITDLKVNGSDLSVEYTVTSGWTTTKYTTTYQDDTSVKKYNTEWEAVYPIVLWNHLLEKEESDLYASYILPSSDCKLEFRASANHYHFWTFKVPHETTTPWVWSLWYPWLANSPLIFIERNDDYLTFRLDWRLPLNANFTWQLISPWKPFSTYISYTEVNHFRKIWEVTTDKFTEWEFRFHNLNNKLELPKSYSLQIMVKGKGNQNYTPELFALDLVANQRDRW